MSLIVKGISLPRSCSTCRFSYFTVGIKKRCEISGDEVNPLIDHRDINCPLTELPTPHGRLIDADRLLALVEKEVNNTCIGCEPEPDDCCAYDRFKEIISEIKTAQTIIEAEVSE